MEKQKKARLTQDLHPKQQARPPIDRRTVYVEHDEYCPGCGKRMYKNMPNPCPVCFILTEHGDD